MGYDGGGVAPDRIVLGYYPAWDCGLPPSLINFRQFTHLAHAFASPTPDGGLTLAQDKAGKNVTHWAHAAGVKVLLSLGGGGGSTHFPAVMRDPAKADRLVGETVRLVETNQYDGVDCDWEFPGTDEEADQLVRLITALRHRLPATTLTMAVNAGGWNGRWFDHERLLPLFDFLNVMNYDFHGPWGDHAGHNAPLHEVRHDPDGFAMNAAAGMAYWHLVKGFPREKLCFGLPCYGRGFLASRWGEKTAGKAPHEYVAWKDCRLMMAQGWKRTWDPEAGVPWLTKAGTGELISYEDEESAEAKGRWAAAQGFRGIFFWEISQDVERGSHMVVAAARKGFLGKT